jgi:hypothetical protein
MLSLRAEKFSLSLESIYGAPVHILPFFKALDLFFSVLMSDPDPSITKSSSITLLCANGIGVMLPYTVRYMFNGLKIFGTVQADKMS